MLFALAGAARAQSQTQAQERADSCAQCHPKELAAEAAHPHRQSGIGCADCHGGDRTQADKAAAKAPGTGYTGKLSRRAIAELCGNCHADVTRMNPFDLRTDQLAQYRTSKHGQGLFERNDDTVAVCTDCHGAHGILGRRDPASPVHPSHVPATCARCHADAARMKPHDLEATVHDDYSASVHGKLLAKGDLSAPHCATCHGHHGATPPGAATVAAACGKCHVREDEFFRKSPHQKMEDQDLNTCVVCHGSHKVRPAQLGIYNTACKVCHATGDRGMTTRDQLVDALQTTADLVTGAEQQLERAQRRGTATPEDHALLERARTALRNLPPAQHALDPALLTPIAKDAAAAVTRLQSGLQQAESQAQRKRLALVPVVLFLALMSLGSWVRFRRIHAAHRRGAA